MSEIKRVVLAYSGGLDTSVIAKWLEVERGLEVVTFTADLGQGEEIESAREKARAMGIPDKHIFIEDLREEFVRDFVFPSKVPMYFINYLHLRKHFNIQTISHSNYPL